MADEEPKSAPTFKKRAKATFKRKHDSSDDDESDQLAANVSVAELLRQRKQNKARRNVTISSQVPNDDARDVAVVAGNTAESDVDKMKNRFVVQTGEVVGLYDKQM
jgi:hypothetical protein